jgi:hypothetical protein
MAVGLRRGTAGAVPQSGRFHDDRSLFGRSHVGRSGGDYRNDPDG